MARHSDETNLYSASKLTALTGVPERTITRILDALGVKSVKAKGYPIEAAIRAIVSHFKDRAESTSSEMETDKAAKLKAERVSAEVDAAKATGEVVYKSDVEADYRDKWTKIRACIDTFRGMDEATKVALLAAIYAIQEPPDASGS